MRLRTFLIILLALAGLAAALRADVIHVDPTETDLQGLVDAASDGDILVLPSSYDHLGAEITGKGLTLIGAGGARPTLSGVTIRDLPATSLVVLRGLALTAKVSVIDSPGTVVLEDCAVQGAPGFQAGVLGFNGQDALGTQHAESILVLRCDLAGGDGADDPGSLGTPTGGGAGASLRESRAVFADSTLTGGLPGENVIGADPSTSGNGLDVWLDGHAIALGSTLQGGGGDPGWGGGDGLAVLEPSQTWLVGTELLGGAGVPIAPSPHNDTILDLAAAPRTLAVSGPLAPGDAGVLGIEGQAGDLVAIGLSSSGAWLPLIGKSGAFNLGSPFAGLFVLGLAPSDSWTIPFVAPNLPPGIDGATQLVQVFARDGVSGQTVFGGSTAFVLVR